MLDRITLGNNLRLVRVKQGKDWTQEVVANLLHTSQGNYARFEKGEREPSLSLLVDFADHFEVSIDSLLGRNRFLSLNNGGSCSNADAELSKEFVQGVFSDIQSLPSKSDSFSDLTPEQRTVIETSLAAFRRANAASQQEA